MIQRSNRMSDKKKPKSVILEENILKLYCDDCSKKSDNFFNDFCVNCVLRNYYKFHKKQIQSISLESFNFMIEYNKLLLFLDFFHLSKEIKVILKKSYDLKKNCNFKEFKCEIFDIITDLSNLINSFYNPVYIYKELKNIKSNIRDIKVKKYCNECFSIIVGNVDAIFQKIKNLEIITEHDNFIKKNDLYINYFNFYHFIFSEIIKNHDRKPIKKEKRVYNKLLDTYQIQKYGIFNIFIYKKKNRVERTYIHEKFFENKEDEDFFNRILVYTFRKIKIIKLDEILSIEDLIDSYYYKAIRCIDEKFNISNIKKKKLALLVAIKILNLDKIFHLLLDDYIEEIFLDSPEDKIYINHQKYGRCRTLIKFTQEEIERLKTLFRLYSGERLDYSNPNLKFVLNNKFFYCRFTCDISPINFKGFSFDIRKLNKNIFTIQDLLHNNTINPKIASFLYFCILNKINITVTGKTDSGKTTLVNALDLMTPREFRKIYIENAIESLDQAPLGKHQLKFKVNSLSEEDSVNYKKSGQIKTLLHRTPDLIYLGEILTKEECNAMFHCLTVGLKGFQTIHSNDIKSLINRLLFHFNIEKPLFNELDIIVLMKKDKFERRKIVSINQIFIDNNKIINKTIFRLNPKNGSWSQMNTLYELEFIKNLIKFDNLSKCDYELILDIYEKLFFYLKKKEKIQLSDLISFFDKISFLSKKSIENLINFKNSILTSKFLKKE